MLLLGAEEVEEEKPVWKGEGELWTEGGGHKCVQAEEQRCSEGGGTEERWRTETQG